MKSYGISLRASAKCQANTRSVFSVKADERPGITACASIYGWRLLVFSFMPAQSQSSSYSTSEIPSPLTTVSHQPLTRRAEDDQQS